MHDFRELIVVARYHQVRSQQVSEQLDATAARCRARIDATDDLLASLAHLVDVEALRHSMPASPPRALPEPAVAPVAFHDILAEAHTVVGTRVTVTEVLTPQELEEVLEQLTAFEQDWTGRTRMDFWDGLAASLSGLLTGVLDAVWVGPTSKGATSKALSMLGAPNTHAPDSPKVSFDYVLKGAKGNHRWNSIPHHPGPGGLIRGIRDVLGGTSTHIVHGVVRTVNHTTDDVQKTLEAAGLADPSALFILRVLRAAQLVMRHWWSDVNTSMGLPAPFTLLAKFMEFGSIPYDGGTLTISDFAQKLWEQGLDLRRFIGDSLTVFVNEVLVRLFFALRCLAAGGTLGEALPVVSSDKPRLRSMLLLAHTITTATNLGKLVVTGNPLLVNLPQWLAMLRYLGGHVYYVVFQEADAKDAAHRQAWSDRMRVELVRMHDIEAALAGCSPYVLTEAHP